VFIEPFEKCDASKKYLLTKEEFGACLESDEELKQLNLKESDATKIFELSTKMKTTYSTSLTICT